MSEKNDNFYMFKEITDNLIIYYYINYLFYKLKSKSEWEEYVNDVWNSAKDEFKYIN